MKTRVGKSVASANVKVSPVRYGPAASVYDTVDNGPVRQSSKLHPAQLAEDYGFAPLPMLPPVANRKEKPATAASPKEDASEAPFDALR